MRDRAGHAVADDDVGAAVEDRLDQARDIGALVLIVAVGIDDDVGAEPQAGVEPDAEGARQALVVLVDENMIDAKLPRHLDRAVRRSIADDEDFHVIDAVDLARNIRHRRRQRLLFVVTGNLNNQLHARVPDPVQVNSLTVAAIPYIAPSAK